MKIKLSLKPGVQVDNKVSCIKAWRSISGLGLKEAKDAVEAVMAGQPQMIDSNIAPNSPVLKESLDVLTGQGMLVEGAKPVKDVIIRGTESLAKLALENGEYDLAIDLTQILKKHSGKANA